MKKTLLLLLLMALAYFTLVHAQSQVGVGLQLRDTQGPIIIILQPNNNSGLKNINISIIYNVVDASDVKNCSLMLDGAVVLTDVTVSKSVPNFFLYNNTPLGLHNWSINCTDVLNQSNAIRIKLGINRMTRFNASTTNISAFNVTNIPNLVFEIAPYGKINFTTPTDLSTGYHFDAYVDIGTNRITINSTYVDVLDKPASLVLYQLNYTNPRILRDGSVCPSNICTNKVYASGSLYFDVTEFSEYTAEEGPAEEAQSEGDGGGGGGGGSGGKTFREDFEIDKNTLKIILKQGQTKRERITIKNTGDAIIDMKADLGQIVRFMVSPESSLVFATLNPGEQYTIELTLKATEKDEPDLYPGKIIFTSDNVRKELITLIEVESADPLFDVDVEVLPQSKKTLPGKEILFEVNLFNVRSVGRVDVFVDYVIKDIGGNTVAVEQETLAVETQARFTRSVLVPSDLGPGTYVAFVKVGYGDATALSSDLFEIVAKEIRLHPIALATSRPFLIGLGSVLAAGLLAFMLVQYRKAPAPGTETRLMEEQKMQKMQNELRAIEDAYKSKFISQEAYSKEKKRISEKMNPDQPK